ncbi:LemA family protein [Psychroflexus montanilacus]|uniref:LemA family protein n=1 Tax=Psychroflexus montanilacus TaxID=2873598 RepID=UPI001CCC71F6|nr:LemA family protein [Psychroflexus montanilacus]MBZ9651379.1 LemA family protein [Psychroflexus montanilacus]
MGIFIVIGVIVVLVIWIIAIYNNLVNLRNRRENAFADIDVQLKQRHDLIPQLVNAVKGYMTHERETLESVTNARRNAINASTVNDKIAAEKELGSALQGLNVQVEAYPDLKANENFMQLQTEISDIENKLAAVRRFFNSATRELNTAIEKFPNLIFAGMFGFSRQPMFDLGEARSGLDKAPEVSF